MFQNQSAWFSSSVPTDSTQLWKDNGGFEADFDEAEFIFSSDSTCPDTQRVFGSSAYQSDHLAVFHSRYIDDCVHAGDKKEVVLGHYFLPPQDIIEMVSKQKTFCWNVPSTVNSKQPTKQLVIKQPSKHTARTGHSPHKVQGSSRNNQVIENKGVGLLDTNKEAIHHISTMKKVNASELTEFIPGEDGAQVFRKG